MPDTDHRPNVPDLPPEDKMGFAVPKTPAHRLMLLNRYMRTDMPQHIHVRLHKMRDENEPGLFASYGEKPQQVIGTWDGINLALECFTRNHLHIDPDYEFRPEQDYLHDIRCR